MAKIRTTHTIIDQLTLPAETCSWIRKYEMIITDVMYSSAIIFVPVHSYDESPDSCPSFGLQILIEHEHNFLTYNSLLIILLSYACQTLQEWC